MKQKGKIWGLLPAAGIGKRFGEEKPKQYLLLGNQALLWHSLRRICDYSKISGVALGIAEGDPYWPELNYTHKRFIGTYTGGKQRANTVLNGLEFLLRLGAENSDWVIVHDCVRPCITQEDLHKLVAAIQENQAGIVLAVPISDTLKQVNAQGDIIASPSRNDFWRAMTPQCFTIGELKTCLQQAIDSGLTNITDESSAVERFGRRPRVLQGRPDNIKITWPEDLKSAEYIMQQQLGEFS